MDKLASVPLLDEGPDVETTAALPNPGEDLVLSLGHVPVGIVEQKGHGHGHGGVGVGQIDRVGFVERVETVRCEEDEHRGADNDEEGKLSKIFKKLRIIRLGFPVFEGVLCTYEIKPGEVLKFAKVGVNSAHFEKISVIRVKPVTVQFLKIRKS